MGLDYVNLPQEISMMANWLYADRERRQEAEAEVRAIRDATKDEFAVSLRQIERAHCRTASGL